MEKITTLIVRGNGWTIKRTASHGIILTFLDLLFEIGENNGDKVIIADEIKNESSHVIIIYYEKEVKK